MAEAPVFKLVVVGDVGSGKVTYDHFYTSGISIIWYCHAYPNLSPNAWQFSRKQITFLDFPAYCPLAIDANIFVEHLHKAPLGWRNY